MNLQNKEESMRSQEQKLLELLSNHSVTFFIPPYQRNYEWDESQCSAFWDDILFTYKKNKSGCKTEHFFGTLTYFQSESVFGLPTQLVLIDGQQRVTTTMLFLLAMRDLLDNIHKKEFIDCSYLKNEKVAGGNEEYKIKLKQVEVDWPVYKNLVLGKKPEPRDVYAAVYRNYSFFKRKLAAHRMADPDLTKLIDWGISQFSVVTVELDPKNSWENPQEIFESMNSLGKPLSLSDLVRNYLLMGKNANEQEQLYQTFWLEIEKVIPGNIHHFIRDFIQLRTGRAQKKATQNNAKDLYRVFKEYVKGKDIRQEEILSDFSRLAPLYAAIISGKMPGHADIEAKLGDLLSMQASVANSFLLGLLEQHQKGCFNDFELSEILDAFRIYVIRLRILGLSAAANKAFPELVRDFDKLKACPDKRQKMFDILSTQQYNLRVPSNVEIAAHLMTANFYNFAYKKFILALVEERLTKSRPDLSDPNLQIEHIMPQMLNGTWKAELGEDAEKIHEELGNTIGNLTLIRHNQVLGNKSFQEKKKIYENYAGLQIAKTDITNCDKWNAETIKNRTMRIVAYLVNEVLPVPVRDEKRNFLKPKGLSFEYLGLVGENIRFIENPAYVAKVVSDNEVEFEDRIWRLSALTAELKRRLGKATLSEAYRGSQYWEYEGTRLETLVEQG